MKTKFKSIIRTTCHLFNGVICAGAVLLIASSVHGAKSVCVVLG